MISIEADMDNKEKYEFNKPLNCIEMHYGLSSEVLPSLDWTNPIRSVIWLDYDGYLEKFMLEDLETIIAKMTSGSMFFISFNSSWSRGEDKVKQTQKRQELYKKALGVYSPIGLSNFYFTDRNKHKTQCKPINNTINSAVSLRKCLVYSQLIDFVYQDGAEMTTIGGILLDGVDKEKFKGSDFSHLGFVNQQQSSDAFSLKIPPLTYKEVVRIFENLPCDDYSKIIIPGLDAGHIEQIAKVYRYYPFYTESTMFT